MRARRRFVAGLLAAVLVVVSVPGAAGGGAAAEPAAAPSEPTGEGPLRVTLVTGDQVDLRTVDGELVPRVEPAEGREGVRFSIHRAGDHLYVVPSDAIGLLGEGRLDRRLFDVATLVSFGYDDAHRSDLPLIVQAGPGGGRPAEAGEVAEAAAATEAAVAGTGGEVQALPAASATGVRQPKAHLPELWAELTRSGTRGASTGGGGAVRSLEAGIGTVWLDGLRQPSLDVSVPQIGAPAAWEAGYTGAGVTVAVLDSGIDATHPDLAGRIAGARNFTDEADPDDLVGHGTHVASTIAGSGAASGGRYRGVAPDARLLDGKVCDVFGCPESAVLAGMQWAADSGARVVNLSVGGEDTPGVDPLEAAIDALSAENGTLFVVAAGNDGPDEGTVASPASADAALAVGAVDDDDQLAEFSSRGPRVGDAVLKPEITAPGVGIVAARARNGFLGEPVGDRYVALDGTSMATPHVAGAAALVAQQHPGWTGAELEDLLVGSAATADGVDAFAQGAGRVDVGRAVAQDVYAEPAVVSAGRPAWPHGDDEPVTRTITYRNPGPEPVALALTVEGIGPDGEPAPPGVFTLGTDHVSVPAGGGQASVEVTVDTSRPGPDGHLSAWVTATSGDSDAATDTAGDTVVTTPIAVDREAESYDLTVVNRDRNGAPASVYRAMVFGLDRNLSEFPSDPDGTFTVRLPRGRYLVDSLVQTRPEAERPDTAQLVQPLVDLDHDQTIELDARRARPLDIEIDSEHGDPRLQWALSAYSRLGELASVTSVLGIFDTLDGVTTGSFGPPVGRDEMVAQFQGAWAGEGERIYNLAWFDHGRMTTGLSRRVRDAQLARVTTDYQAIGEGRSGQHFTVPQAPGTRPFAWGAGDPAPLPGRRVELYTTRGVEWSGQVVQTLADPDDPDGLPTEEVWLDSRPRRYDAGRAYHERWNAAVLGPVVSDGTSTWCAELLDQTSERVGDRVTVSVAMLGDAAGHPGCGEVTGSTRLVRDGETVGETPSAGFGQFEVPADPGTYRIETDLTRHPQAVLSTRITATWTFRSRHVNGDEPEPLPLMAVRFAPELDAHNRVPAGGRYEIPLSIDRLGDVGRIAQPHVEASFDDGRHWTPLRVTRRPDNRYVASLTHPHTPGFVSLLATATDNHGNTVEQTIIRAYELTSP